MKKTVKNRDQRRITDRSIEDYLDSLCPGNSAVLEDIRIRAEEDDIPIIRRNSEELLKTMLAARRPGRILEIGTAVGYSALVMAQTLPDSDIVTLEIGELDHRKALANIRRYEEAAGHEDSSQSHVRINALHVNADDYLPKAAAEGRKFDFVFLDAAKAQYIKWLAMILELLEDGGMLMADNVLLDGTVACSRYAIDRRERTAHQRMREFLYAVTHDPRLTTCVLASGDGVSISVYHKNHKDGD